MLASDAMQAAANLEGQLSAALGVPGAIVWTALLVVLALRARARATTGEPRHQDLPRRLSRRLALAVPLALVAAWALQADLLPTTGTLLVVVPALCLVVATPGRLDAVLGTQGVARGFEARRFEDLEEWRLTGDHLRWRLHGEWTSSPCPAAEHEEWRKLLEERCGATESRFRD
ncbi:MAG: hypothetical protein RIR65_1655 [Planctomycetota bacterium]